MQKILHRFSALDTTKYPLLLAYYHYQQQRMETTTNPKIFVTDGQVTVSELGNIANVVKYERMDKIEREELLKRVPGCTVLFCTLRDKIDRELIEAAGPQLKLVATMSVGYEHIDLDECKKHQIRVANTAGVSKACVAELAVAMALAVARRLPEAIRCEQRGEWTSWMSHNLVGRCVAGATVGIFGMGKIGRDIARKLGPFDPSRIIYHDIKDIDDPIAKTCQRVPFDQILAESDFLIIAANASAGNRGLFNGQVFERMKREAILINIGRGEMVDHDALYEALNAGQIWGAGLDVTMPEPLPITHKLFTSKKCIILPHIGSGVASVIKEMCMLTERNIVNFIKGLPMPSEVKIP